MAGVLILCLGIVGCSDNSTGEAKQADESFDIGMVTFAGYAPLYLAVEKGFFGDLDVQLRRIEEVPSIRAAVASGDLEAYLATPDIALDTNTAPPGRAIWAIDESAGGDGVVVAEGIESIEGLRGRSIAGEPGLPPYFILLYLLHENGLSLSDLNFRDTTTPNAANAFASGAVHAAAIYEPFLSQAKNQQPGSRVVLSSAQTPGLIVDLIFAREDVIDERSEDVQQIIDGWLRAVEYIEESPDDAYSIMAAAFNLPVDEFRDIASGIRWLGLSDNQRLYGTAMEPGPLYSAFESVVEVLQRNRPDVYDASAEDYLIRDFVTSQ